ncbi:MAG: hypothetical protein KGL95_14660, partial [Patescibacteria group bacterium]|nr:hypothetical protein [Patescibacteria group bacterium]
RNDGRPMIALPNITLDDSEKDYVVSTLKSFGQLIAEINSSLPSGMEQQFGNVVNTYQIALSTGLAMQQGATYGDNAVLFEPLNNFMTNVLAFERAATINGVLTGSTRVKNYSEAEVQSIIRSMEKQRNEIRRKLHLRRDNNMNQLFSELSSPQNDEVLDQAVAKLLHLVGFDSEIYGRRITGEVDVVGIHLYEKHLAIIDTTTGSISKAKIDQILGRKTDYEKFSTKTLGTKLTVFPIVVTSNTRVFSDDLAKKEAMINKVSIISTKEIEEVLHSLKKGKMSPDSFIQYVLKKIPVS